jgi:membrane-bound ClpP family serine protease
MSWLAISGLIVLGCALLFIEIFFIPGTAVLALIGVFTMLLSVYFSFTTHGATGGLIAIGGSIVLFVFSLWIAFKSGLLQRLSLKTTNQGRMNVVDDKIFHLGETGIAHSKIAPIGTARFGDWMGEVRSFGEYVDAGEPIEIVKIEDTKIFIKSKLENSKSKI